MTTPDPASPGETGEVTVAAARMTRPEPARIDPIRSGRVAAEAVRQAAQAGAPPPSASSMAAASATGATGPAPPSRDGGEAIIADAVADVVKSGYDVLEETISQGRAAAEKFRQGEYNFRQVPGDIEDLALRLLTLARQLSTTTFDICERLLHQIGSAGGPPPAGQVAAQVPPFIATPFIAPGARTTVGHPPPPTAPQRLPEMRLTVRFAGTGQAVARSSTLARPERPTTPSDITVTPLTAREGAGAALTEVAFEADLAAGGLVATVTIPPGQPAGTYAGLVCAAGQAVPLGMLVVELVG